ncbi:MAG: dockerin type I repeat-containing protein, partial [Clostridia bacterium]|nr:dockerin type I repeat-containing protein [Clostridia bacterium]
SGVISTGDKLIVYKGDGKEFVNKPIVVYGDVSGDGKISIIDLANVQKHILKVKEQSGAYFTAADTNKDGKISIIDLANVQKHILKVKSIKQ